jgi:hypothetical protein
MSLRVKIGDKEISKITSVHASITADVDKFGDRKGFSNPLHIIISRDGKEEAELTSFNAAVSRPNKVSSATVEFTDSTGITRYTLTLNNAFVSAWRIGTDVPDGDLIETMELYCGDAEFAADAKSQTYKLDDFNL